MTVGVHSECTYKAMVRVFDELTVRLVLDRVGSSSYTVGFDFLRGDEVVTHGDDDLRLPDAARAARRRSPTSSWTCCARCRRRRERRREPGPAGRHRRADHACRSCPTTTRRRWRGRCATQADLQAIRDLGVLYARAVDDHAIDALVAMYTPDGVFERRGVPATGTGEIRAAYVASFDTYRTMLHTAHPGVVQLHGDGTASGWSHGHAELATRQHAGPGRPTGTRTTYRRVDGRWLFARRSITLHVRRPRRPDGRRASATRERMRWPRTEPEAADYPETAPTWDTYRTELRPAGGLRGGRARGCSRASPGDRRRSGRPAR